MMAVTQERSERSSSTLIFSIWFDETLTLSPPKTHFIPYSKVYWIYGLSNMRGKDTLTARILPQMVLSTSSSPPSLGFLPPRTHLPRSAIARFAVRRDALF